MKQKVVIKVSLNDQKSRTKAIKTAVGVDGVTQASLQQEKDQIVVAGEDIDVVLLTTLLRKSLKHAEVVSVGPADQKKDDDKKDTVVPVVWPSYVPVSYYHEPAYVSSVQPYHQDPSCSIM